jgi:hypothetical protein
MRTVQTVIWASMAPTSQARYNSALKLLQSWMTMNFPTKPWPALSTKLLLNFFVQMREGGYAAETGRMIQKALAKPLYILQFWTL